MHAGVGEDLARMLVDLAGGEEGGAGDGEGDDDRLEDDNADEPTDDGAGGVLLGLCREELLVHGLVAEHEQAGGQEELEALHEREVAEDLKVGGRQRGVDGGPASGMVDQDRQREQHGDGGEQTDDHIHIGDRGHAGNRREDDDEGGDDVAAQLGGDEGGEDEVEDVAAAEKLITGDGGVGEEDGDDAEHTRGLVVAGLEQVGDGELGELAGARRDEIDQ